MRHSVGRIAWRGMVQQPRLREQCECDKVGKATGIMVLLEWIRGVLAQGRERCGGCRLGLSRELEWFLADI